MPKQMPLLMTIWFIIVANLMLPRVGQAQPAPIAGPQNDPLPLSYAEYSRRLEARIRTEFSDWRYAGANLSSLFKRGSVLSVEALAKDPPAAVWSFYVGKILAAGPILHPQLLLPVQIKWPREGTGEESTLGSNPLLGTSYAVTVGPSLTYPTAQGQRQVSYTGRIVFQHGQETVCITIRPYEIEPAPAGAPRTQIDLLKIVALNGAEPDLINKPEPLDLLPLGPPSNVTVQPMVW